MAASAVPPGNQDVSAAARDRNGSHSALPGAGAAGYSETVQVLKHNPGLSEAWSVEEQAILEAGLSKFASEPIVIRYAKIAMDLPEKTVRDVALRCRWMTKKESGKRRKEDCRKNNKREKVTDPSSRSRSHLAERGDVTTYSSLTHPVNNDEITYQDIGGQTGHLIQQNVQIFNQISANLASLQLPNNIDLFCQARDNIVTIVNDMTDMPSVMRQMPPFPEKINEELANLILPPRSMPMR